MELSLSQIGFIASSVLCLLTLTKCILVNKENKFILKQLTETMALLATSKKQLNELQIKHRETITFHKAIEQAELTTKLQAPRLQAAHGEKHQQSFSSVPEKYSYIRSLTEKGMSPEEIASVLSISTYEASQLVALTMITATS